MSLSHNEMRAFNTLNILNVIVREGAISRVRLSRRTGLSQSTVSKITSKCIDRGIIFETDRESSSLGRKPVMLKLNEKYRYYGVIDVNLWETTIALCDLEGTQIESKIIDTPVGEGEKFFDYASGILAEMVKKVTVPVAGISIILPCPVNCQEGLVYWNYSLGWDELDIRSFVGKHFDCEILVENDARAGALAEQWFAPEAKNQKDFIFFLVCSGVGTGIVISNRLYYGTNFLNGIFYIGSIEIEGNQDSPISAQSWENKSSNVGISQRYAELTGAKLEKNRDSQVREIIALARENDHAAIKALRESAEFLGFGIASLNNGLNPGRIIIGGDIAQAWDIISPTLLEKIRFHTPHRLIPFEEVIVPSSLTKPTIEGARAMILQMLFGGCDLVQYPYQTDVQEISKRFA